MRSHCPGPAVDTEKFVNGKGRVSLATANPLDNQGLKRVRMRLFTAVIVVFTPHVFGIVRPWKTWCRRPGRAYALLLIVILPLLWSVPMAFVSSGARIARSRRPAASTARIRRGLGEYWSFQAGWWWTLSLYVDSAVYVALALDYLENKYGRSTAGTRALIGIAIVALFTFINIRGLDLTGWALTIIQFGVMVPLADLHRREASSTARATRPRPGPAPGDARSSCAPASDSRS